MKKMWILFTFAIVLLALVGCGTNEEEEINGEEDLSSSDDSQFVEYGVAGDIVEITPSDNEDTVGSIQVKGPDENGAIHTEAVVTITPDTKIYLNDLTDFASLEVGMYVNVFFEGDVRESFPVQATAKQVNIIPDDAK
ncbi:DUF3221 domain-containing protein [Salipaludibacillus sp. HK11]|uniref:DUF3221 domain-containing protein n=1 Tax=Salipaludibacillus sp. HK11 TaxID=3394320 RepID=UPI0039FD9506